VERDGVASIDWTSPPHSATPTRGIEDGFQSGARSPITEPSRERVTILVSFQSSWRGRRPSAARSPSRSPNQSSQHHEAQPVAVKAPAPPLTPEIAEAIKASPFAALGIADALVRATLDEQYKDPSPIQAEIIPHVVARRDVIGCAQTGTGKTAAFVLPLLQLLSTSADPRGPIRVLILTPTRELAAQIGERIEVYGRYLGIRHAIVYGGVSQHRQEIALRQSPDMLVATPGRLLDLMQQRLVKLDGVTHFVLDEADRMLDMGFVNDVRRVVAAIPTQRQTLLFSATMPQAIEALAQSLLKNPVRVSITPAVTTAERVEQSVVFVAKADKRAMLETVLRDGTVERALVFTRTKHGANRLSEQLDKAGIGSAAIHGNKTQGARERALEAFRKGTTRVLVATDVAARGIDVDGISLVVNFDLPNVAESYVHRIGRTGRAGASGRAISFCDRDERPLLTDIERFIRRRLPSSGTDAGAAAAASPGAAAAASPASPARQGRPRRYRGSRW